MEIKGIKGLFEIQRKLDNEIEAKHPASENEDRFEKRKLALLVEIGELANEQRSWKFWSADKKPRTIYQTTCNANVATHHYCEDCKEDVANKDTLKHFKKCEGILYPMRAKNPLLEEFVDCIHFLLSIGNFYADFEPNFYKEYEWEFESIGDSDVEYIPAQFNAIYRYASKLGGGHNEEFEAVIDIRNYEMVFDLFSGLSKQLGFTEAQIVDAYLKKNKINYERQANGY